MNNTRREQRRNLRRGRLHRSTAGRCRGSTAAALHLVRSEIGRFQWTLDPG